MYKQKVVSPAKFFKRFLFYFIALSIIIEILFSVTKLKQGIVDSFLGFVPKDNFIGLIVVWYIVSLLISAAIAIFLVWFSARRTFNRATVESAESNKVLIYFSVIYIAYIFTVTLLEILVFGPIHNTFGKYVLNQTYSIGIHESVFIVLGFISRSISFGVSFIFLKKCLAAGTCERPRRTMSRITI